MKSVFAEIQTKEGTRRGIDNALMVAQQTSVSMLITKRLPEQGYWSQGV